MESWEIYDPYYSKVRKFILALVRDPWTADDLIQETFLRVQQSLGTLKDSSKLSSWIYRIAYNLCQDHFRQRKARKENTSLEQTEGLEEFLVQKGFIQEELEQQEMGRCVQNQIDLLTEPLRAVLVLFDIMECSHQEIADILGITVANVKVRLHRAREKLKSTLEKKCVFERDERNVLVCTPVDHGPKDDQMTKGQGGRKWKKDLRQSCQNL